MHILFKVNMPPILWDAMPSKVGAQSFTHDYFVNLAGETISRTNPYHRHFETMKEALDYTVSQLRQKQKRLREEIEQIDSVIHAISTAGNPRSSEDLPKSVLG